MVLCFIETNEQLCGSQNAHMKFAKHFVKVIQTLEINSNLKLCNKFSIDFFPKPTNF